MFQVLCLETKEYLHWADGSPVQYLDGHTAKLAADSHSAMTGKKHQVRRVVNQTIDWRQREQDRFNNGTYQRLPWEVNHYWWSYLPLDIFPHISTKDKGRVAFTENAEKGAADIQTSIKPGRFLERFFGDHLSQHNIRFLAAEFLATFGDQQLFFAQTPDEIEAVYLNGPPSCMSGDEFESNIHPVRVYGAGDLAVAYLAPADDNGAADIDMISARAVCWPDKHLYSRTYGNAHQLDSALRTAGYKPGRLDGARLLLIRDNGGVVMPYIDWHDWAGYSDDKKHLIIGRRGFSTGNTNGLSGTAAQICAHCEREPLDDDAYHIHDVHEVWCLRCTVSDAFHCQRTGNWYSTEIPSVTVMPREEQWSEYALMRYGWTCETCDTHYDGSYHPIDHCPECRKESETESETATGEVVS